MGEETEKKIQLNLISNFHLTVLETIVTVKKIFDKTVAILKIWHRYYIVTVCVILPFFCYHLGSISMHGDVIRFVPPDVWECCDFQVLSRFPLTHDEVVERRRQQSDRSSPDRNKSVSTFIPSLFSWKNVAWKLYMYFYMTFK